MKALILAAGYGTRLIKDADLCKDEKLKKIILTTPKPLLPIKNKPIIQHTIEKINKIEEISEIFIVTNDKFYGYFEEWLSDYDNEKITLINDNTTSNEDRLGAIGDMEFVIKKFDIDDDLMIIAGDNFFEINLEEIYDYFKQKNSSIICAIDLLNKEKLRKRLGVVEVDDENKIIGFEEKPEEPKTTLAASLIYIIKREDLKLSDAYLKSETRADAIGIFISWLCKRTEVYAFVFGKKYKWFDIGSLESYKEANK